MRSCSTCSFVEVEVNEGVVLMTCRRYPPQVVEVSGGLECGHTAGVTFPAVGVEDWCGEWVQRE